MIRQAVLFGAGKLAIKYAEALDWYGVELLFYVDNNQRLWGTTINDKIVKSPDSLLSQKVPILIANQYLKEIGNQLEKMHLREYIITMSEIFSQNWLVNDKKYQLFLKADIVNENPTIVLDNLNGKWGGAEDWVHLVGGQLISRGYHVIIFESEGQKRQPPEIEKSIVRLDRSCLDYRDLHLHLIKTLSSNLPLYLIDNTASEVLQAACLVKHYFPDKVRILAMVLNDSEVLHTNQIQLNDLIYGYLCVSSKLKNKYLNTHHISKNKVYFKQNFTSYDSNFNKKYSDGDKPIQLGYACRLEREQKRADLLPWLIELLEQKRCNYMMNVIGDGECYTDIRTFVEDSHLSHKVKLFGFVNLPKLLSLWEYQDVYVNFSEYEGMSLAMLEAMSKGVVPVVTNVSGVEDVIKHGENGLIYKVGDIEGIAEGICILDEKRNFLQEYGIASRKAIKEKCNVEAYIDYICNVMQI